MIKRETIILYILIAAAFLISGINVVYADGCDKYNIYIDNNKLDREITVQVFNGFDYVPLSQMQSYLGLTIKEDKAVKGIDITLREKTIKIISDTIVETNNGASSKMDVPPIAKDNIIYLPLIKVVDMFGWQVEVMDDVKCIRIKTSAEAAPIGNLLDIELNQQMGKGTAANLQYPRVAYLTFDDGLDSRVTPLVLDILKANDIKATFFIMGQNVEKNKSLLKRMFDEGHSIGNHTYTHRKENIYRSAAGLKQEIDKTNAAIFNVIGITPKFFRPPYGGPYIRKDMFKSVLSPYRIVLWNVDSMDSKSTSIKSDEIIRNVVNQVKNKKSAIIIMHDSGTHMETAKALPAIIKYLKDNGFVILPIEETTSLYYEY